MTLEEQRDIERRRNKILGDVVILPDAAFGSPM